jgi:hypothetical protein
MAERKAAWSFELHDEMVRRLAERFLENAVFSDFDDEEMNCLSEMCEKDVVAADFDGEEMNCLREMCDKDGVTLDSDDPLMIDLRESFEMDIRSMDFRELTILRRLSFLEMEDLESLDGFQRSDMPPLYGLSTFATDLVHFRIPQVASSGLHVLITGETGVGKDLVAQQIAIKAKIPKERFIAVNCAAIPPGLAESELFGHKKGAFTGALEDKDGFFKMANDGILFLDEIGEFPRDIQAKLLRALQEKKITPVGGEPEKVSVRLIAATNNPDALREDILWRFPERIHIPPLRERKADIFPILRGILHTRFPDQAPEWKLSPITLLAMLLSPWPGNIRELVNMANISLKREKLLFGEREVEHDSYVAFFYHPSPETAALFPDFVKLTELWMDIGKRVQSVKGGRKFLSSHVDPLFGDDLFCCGELYQNNDRAYQELMEAFAEDPLLTLPHDSITLRQAENLLLFSWEKLLKDHKGTNRKTLRNNPLYLRLADCVNSMARVWKIPQEMIPKYPPPERKNKEAHHVDPLTNTKFRKLERMYFRELREECDSLQEASEISGLPLSTLKDRFEKYKKEEEAELQSRIE